MFPDGNLSASVAETCKVVPGDAVPIPTLELDTSNTNNDVSNAKSVPALVRLADNIGPVIRPIAIVYPLIDNCLIAKLMVFILYAQYDGVKYRKT